MWFIGEGLFVALVTFTERIFDVLWTLMGGDV